MDSQHNLEILADAAKYDASCASSGAARKDSRGSAGVGSTGGAGICYSYAPDGRRISLLKVLLTNACLDDCHYCINRRLRNVESLRFMPDEVVRLTLDFYKRICIEGLILSSGIIRSADYISGKNLTMAPLIAELIADSSGRVERMRRTELRPAKPAPSNAHLDSLRDLNAPERPTPDEPPKTL